MGSATGVANYPAADVIKLKGRRTSEVATILGYQVAGEIIHRGQSRAIVRFESDIIWT